MTDRASRRGDLHRLLAGLILAAALAGLASMAASGPNAAGPPLLADSNVRAAVYRPDGGQALSPAGRLTLNELTLLNLGRRIDLKKARPQRLAVLPGLGPQSAAKARERGCLTTRQRQNLTGLITETCDPIKL